MDTVPGVSAYHIVALVLTGIGAFGIGFEIIPLAIIGALGLGMLLARPPRPPRPPRR